MYMVNAVPFSLADLPPSFQGVTIFVKGIALQSKQL